MTLAMYIVGALLLAVGEAIALSKNTDAELPITTYIRYILKLGPLGFIVLLAIWLWAGCHFLIDTTGAMAC